MQFWQDIHDLFVRPFRADMDAFSVFLAIGLILLILLGWGIILRDTNLE